MPRFFPDGSLCIGLGRDPWDDVRSIGQECNETKPGCRLSLSDGTVMREGGLLYCAANGNQTWAIVPFPEGGYLDSFGRRFPESAPGPIGPDGAIAIKVKGHSFGPWDVLEPDGSRWRLTDGDAFFIQLLGNGRAIWREAGNPHILHARGVTVEQPQGDYGQTRLIETPTGFALLYQSETGGCLVFDGRVIAEGINFYRPDAILLNGVWHFVWSTQEQEIGATPPVLTMPAWQLPLKPAIADRLARPQPIPPTTPRPEPAPMDYLQIIRDIRKDYPTPLGARHWEFLVEVAQATGTLLFRKESGDRVLIPALGKSVNQNIIGRGTLGNRWADILGDAETLATPTFDIGPTPADGEYVDVSQVELPGEPPNPGPIPPNPGRTLEDRVRALENRLAELIADLRAV